MADLEKEHPEYFGPEQDTVLVACPTYNGLADCLDEYLEAYKALKWPRRSLMLVDNTDDGGAYAESIMGKVEAAGGEPESRREIITAAAEVIWKFQHSE